MRNCCFTISGSTAQGAAAAKKKQPVRIIAACITGVWRTKRKPARIAETRCSRGRLVPRGRRCQLSKAMTTTR